MMPEMCPQSSDQCCDCIPASSVNDYPLLTLGVLLLLPLGVLMESRRCCWYFSLMWLVWSLMLWLCLTPAPSTLVTPGGCLQEPPPCSIACQ